MFRLTVATLITGILTGCATLPDVTYSYYPAKWNATVTVTQTVGCNTSKTAAVVLNSPSVTTAYSSKTDSKPFQFKVKDLQSLSADVDMTMAFTDDGRLKSINQSTTGQGEAIIKSAASLITAVGAKVMFTPPKVGAPPSTTLPECAQIDSWGGSKPVTLTYRASITPDNLDSTVPLDAAPETKDLYRLLKNILPTLKVSVGKVTDVISGPSYDKQSSDVVLLELQKIGAVEIVISSSSSVDPLGLSRIVIPQDRTYKLPIPKAALFGKQSFALTLSEAGAVTSVTYGKNVGTAGALNALSTLAGTQTAAAEAADLKSQADLIAQQQRLVLCQTKPEQCK
jgi:hypothetical protein